MSEPKRPQPDRPPSSAGKEETAMNAAPQTTGDVYVGSMAAPVRQVPGSQTVNGKKAVSRIFDDALARVRRRLRSADRP
jgi:hypothetical protein